MNWENIPPDFVDSKHISPRKLEKSPLKTPVSSAIAFANANSKKPLGTPVDLNDPTQWRERNVVITSHQHQENADIAHNIINDLVDNLPCFENPASVQKPSETDLSISPSSPHSLSSVATNSVISDDGKDSGLEEPTDLKTEELDDFSECNDTLPLDPYCHSSPFVVKDFNTIKTPKPGCSPPLSVSLHLEEEKKHIGQSTVTSIEDLAAQAEIGKTSRASLSPDTLLELSEKSLGLPTDLSRTQVQDILDHLPKSIPNLDVTSRIQSLTQEINDLLSQNTSIEDYAEKPTCSVGGKVIEESVTRSTNSKESFLEKILLQSKAATKSQLEKSFLEENFTRNAVEKSFLEEASWKSGPEKSFLEEASLRFDSEISFGEDENKSESLLETSISKSNPEESFIEEQQGSDPEKSISSKQTLKSDPEKSLVEEQPLKSDLEKSLVEEQPLKSDPEKSLVEEQPLKSDPEKSLVEEQPLKSDPEKSLVEEQPLKSDPEKSLVEEQPLKSDPEKSLVEEQPLKSDPEKSLVEEQPLKSDPEKSLVEEQPLKSDPEKSLVEEQPLKSDPEKSLVEEQPLKSDPEKSLVEEQPLKSDPEKSLVEEQPLKSDPEKSLVEEQPLKSDPEKSLVEEQPLKSDPEKSLVEEQPLKSDSEKSLVEEQPLKSDPEKSLVEEQPLKSDPEKSLVEEQPLKSDSEKSLVEEPLLKSDPEKTLTKEQSLKLSPKKFVEDHPLKPEFINSVVKEASSGPEKLINVVPLKFGTENFVAIQEVVLDKTVLESEEPVVEGVILKTPQDPQEVEIKELIFQDIPELSLKTFAQESSLDKSESSPKDLFVRESSLDKSLLSPKDTVVEEPSLDKSSLSIKELVVEESSLDKSSVSPKELIVEEFSLSSTKELVVEEFSLSSTKELVVEEYSLNKSLSSPKELVVEESSSGNPSLSIKELVVEESSLDKSLPSPKELVVEESSLDKSLPSPKELVVEESSLDKSLTSPKELVVEESSLDKSLPSPKELVVEESSLDKSLPSPKELVVKEPSLDKSLPSPKELVVEESVDKSLPPPKELVVKESLDKSLLSFKDIVLKQSSLDKYFLPPTELVVEESLLDKSLLSPKVLVVEESSLNKSLQSPKELAIENSTLDQFLSSPNKVVVEESSLDKSLLSLKEPIVKEISFDKSLVPPNELVVEESSLDKSELSSEEVKAKESVLNKSLQSLKESSVDKSPLQSIAKKENLHTLSKSDYQEPVVEEAISNTATAEAERSSDKPSVEEATSNKSASVASKLVSESGLTKETSVLEVSGESPSQSVPLKDKVDVPKENSFIEKDLASPGLEESVLDTSRPSFIEKTEDLSISNEEVISKGIAIKQDCQPPSSSLLRSTTSFLQEVPSVVSPVTLDSPAPMPTPVADPEREYQENGSTPADTDYVNDNVQNNSFLISRDKPKMEFDENINPFESKCKLGSRSEQNENIIASQTTNFESTEMTNTTQCQKNPLPLTKTEPGDDTEKQKILEEDEGITFDSEKENLASAATAFEDYAENLDSGICDHIETKCDGKVEAEVGVAAVNRRTFRKSTPSLPVDSLPGSPSHANLINETLSGTSSPDLSLGASAPLINHSEAGPEVAQFTEDEFRSAAEVFKDPADFDFLLRAGSSKVLKESTLSRLSLYVKFDPLVKKEDNIPGKTPAPTESAKEPETPRSKDSETPDKKTDQLDNTAKESKKNLNSSKLIEFDSPKNVKAEKTPPKMVPVEPVQRLQDNQTEPGKFFTEEDMKKALQIHDLLYQERLLKKEKEGSEKEQSFKAEIAELQRHVKLQADCISCTRKLLNETTRMSKIWRENKEQERVEQTKERDQALEDLQSVETAFGDLHKRYEKTKAVLEGYKQKENELREELMDCQEKLRKQEQMYEALRTRTEEQLDSANVEIENAKKSGSSELAVLSAQLKKSEMKVVSLERTLVQKEQEYEELSRVYDDLIARFERT